MRDILITGHRGFIGRHLLQYLIEKYEGYTLEMLRKNIDISKPFDLLEKADTVVHCAAISTVNSEQKDRMYAVNVGGTKNVLNAALRLNPELHFIFLSSATVYAPSDNVRDEDSPLGPISDYGKSKLEAEQWLQEQRQKLGFRLTILRPVAVVGRYMTHGLVKAIVDKLMSKVRPVQLLGSPETQSRKQFLHVSDLMRAIDCVIHHNFYLRTHNVVPNDGPLSVEEVFQAVCEVFNTPASMEFAAPTWEGDDTYVNMRSGNFNGFISSRDAVKRAAMEYYYTNYFEKWALNA